MFNFNNFNNNLKSMKNIKNVNKLNDNMIAITYQDELEIYVIINRDSYHKFYTTIDNKHFGKFCYVGEMPHDSYEDLYNEIYRMSNSNLRNKTCKSNYYKSY